MSHRVSSRDVLDGEDDEGHARVVEGSVVLIHLLIPLALALLTFLAYAVVRGGTAKKTPPVPTERDAELLDEWYRYGGTE